MYGRELDQLTLSHSAGRPQGVLAALQGLGTQLFDPHQRHELIKREAMYLREVREFLNYHVRGRVLGYKPLSFNELTEI